MSGEESSDGEVVVCAPLKPRGPAPKWTRGEAGGRMTEPSSSKGEGAGSREELEGRGREMVSEACQGLVQILVA